MSALAIKPTAHVVDVLGNVIGRDQPILRMEKALEMVALLVKKYSPMKMWFFLIHFQKRASYFSPVHFIAVGLNQKAKLNF